MESAAEAEKQCGLDKLSESDIALARLYKRNGEVYINGKTVLMCLVNIRDLIDIPRLKDHLLKHQVIVMEQLDEITNPHHSYDNRVDNLVTCVGRAGGKHGYFLLYVSLCESSERHRAHKEAVHELRKKAKEMKVVAPESILCACRMLHQQQKLRQDDEISAGEADLKDEHNKECSTYKCSSGGDCTIYAYIQGSKCCMSAKNGFHSLCLTKDSYEGLQLDVTLSKQSDVILNKFADLAVNTFEGLSKIAFEDAQRYTNHLVSTGIYDSAVFSRQPITNCISETTSHKELEKELMGNYYSWFNYGMIKNLRKKFLFRDGDDELMQSYEEEFSQYCRRRCFESPLSFHPRPVSTNLKSLVFKTDDKYGKYTLLQARKITGTVASIINSPDYAIYVRSVEEGCVELSCYILPQFELDILNDLQITQLKENNIFSFKIEDKELMPRANDSNRPANMPTIVRRHYPIEPASSEPVLPYLISPPQQGQLSCAGSREHTDTHAQVKGRMAYTPQITHRLCHEQSSPALVKPSEPRHRLWSLTERGSFKREDGVENIKKAISELDLTDGEESEPFENLSTDTISSGYSSNSTCSSCNNLSTPPISDPSPHLISSQNSIDELTFESGVENLSLSCSPPRITFTVSGAHSRHSPIMHTRYQTSLTRLSSAASASPIHTSSSRKNSASNINSYFASKPRRQSDGSLKESCSRQSSYTHTGSLTGSPHTRRATPTNQKHTQLGDSSQDGASSRDSPTVGPL